MTNTDGSSVYTYDANGQVTVVHHTYQTDETYTYDANGNRTNTGYTTGTNNRVTSDGTYNYTYDDEGNRTSQTKISDNTRTEYTWDYRNRLTDVVFKNASGNVTEKIQYKYDVFDRRIGKKLDVNGDGTYDSATYWVYDNGSKSDARTGTSLDDIVLEFIDADGDGAGAATLSTRYLHGPAIDQVLASETVSGNVVNWALSDEQGTVRDIVRYVSGTTTIVDHREYNSIGTVTAESDPTVKFLYGYTGREWDGDAGLYYYRARWYDARMGRFILEDPLGFTAGDTNLNRYVGNSPTNHNDPSGRLWGLGAVAGGAVGGALIGGVFSVGAGLYNNNLSWSSVVAGVTGGAVAGAVAGAVIGTVVAPSFALVAVAGAIGGAAGGTTSYVAGNAISGQPITVGGVTQSAVIGGVAGGVAAPLGYYGSRAFMSWLRPPRLAPPQAPTNSGTTAPTPEPAPPTPAPSTPSSGNAGAPNNPVPTGGNPPGATATTPSGNAPNIPRMQDYIPALGNPFLPPSTRLTPPQVSALQQNLQAVVNQSIPGYRQLIASGKPPSEVLAGLQNQMNLLRWRFIDQVPGGRAAIQNILIEFPEITFPH